jgi:hypothetical protein
VSTVVAEVILGGCGADDDDDSAAASPAGEDAFATVPTVPPLEPMVRGFLP